jgi:hypothetical protein
MDGAAGAGIVGGTRRGPVPGTRRAASGRDDHAPALPGSARLCPAGWAGIVTLDGAVPATAPTAAQVALLEAALPDTGSLPQWRARVGASQRVADKLGYRVLGEQRSLRLTA